MGQRKPRALPTLWVTSRPPSPPHRVKPGERKTTPTGLQMKSQQKCDSTSVPVPDGPSRHVQKPRRRRRPPLRKPPPRPPRRLRPPGTESPLTRNVTAPAGPAAVEAAAARPHPGGGGRKLPRTKELSANDAGTSGREGPPGSRGSAPSPLPRARAQVETRRGGHPPAQPSPRPPREAQTFPQGPGWLVPLAAL